MPVEITERYFDPDDPDDFLTQLAHGRSQPPAEPASPWVEPDYASIPGDGNLPLDETERTLVWPGPAMIMPAGLLPDGKPASYNERENASRICGENVRNGAEADAVVRAYDRQQNALRARAGLPQPISRAPRWDLEDAPETIELIKRLHAEERARRRHRWAS